MSIRFSAIAAACLAGLAFSANAALVRVDFKGTNSSPNSTNVFGAAVPFIEGFVIYEDSANGVAFGTRDTRNYANAIQQVSFSLGDVFSGGRVGNFGSIQVANGANSLSDRLSFNNMILLPSQVEGEPANFRQAQLTLGLASDGRGDPAISSSELLGLFDPTIFDGQKNISVFVARAPGSPSAGAVSFNFNLTEVRVSDPNAVPEPASLALMGLALAGVAAVRRRRRA